MDDVRTNTRSAPAQAVSCNEDPQARATPASADASQFLSVPVGILLAWENRHLSSPPRSHRRTATGSARSWSEKTGGQVRRLVTGASLMTDRIPSAPEPAKLLAAPTTTSPKAPPDRSWVSTETLKASRVSLGNRRLAGVEDE